MAGKQALNATILAKVADIIRSIPDEPVRQVVANHFAQELNRRANSFDVSRWNAATGGRLTGPTRLADLPEQSA